MFCEYTSDAQSTSDLWLSEMRSDLSKSQKKFSKKYNFCFDEDHPSSEPGSFLTWFSSDKEPLGVGNLNRTLFPTFPSEPLFDIKAKLTLEN